MRWYLDASVALHALLPGGDPRARQWLDSVDDDDHIYSSVLLNLELSRTLRREQLEVARARLVTDRLHQVSIDDGILRFAAAIEPHAKSLDAIHLATCSSSAQG
jgi:predicted nucleic acid-binding protein